MNKVFCGIGAFAWGLAGLMIISDGQRVKFLKCAATYVQPYGILAFAIWELQKQPGPPQKRVWNFSSEIAEAVYPLRKGGIVEAEAGGLMRSGLLSAYVGPQKHSLGHKSRNPCADIEKSGGLFQKLKKQLRAREKAILSGF